MEKVREKGEGWEERGRKENMVREKRKDSKWNESMYLEGYEKKRGWFHYSLIE